jgi:hypothetical protein
VYEEVPEGGKMKVVNTYKINGNNLLFDVDQYYAMAIAAGPSMVLVPTDIRGKNDNGNQMYIIDLNTGNAIVRVDQFFQKESVSQPIAATTTKNCNDGKPLRFPIGTPLETKSINNYKTAIVTGFNCNTGKYKIANRSWTPPSKTFFKTDANIGYFLLSVREISDGELDTDYRSTGGLHAVCDKCNGTGIVPLKVTKTAGGSWEQVNFNIHVYTPERVIATWEERAVCNKCNNKGLLKL